MKLSRTVEYAVQATLQLAQAKTNGPVPCSHLASNGGMPERFLLQVLRSLVTHGILNSTRGVDGGYTLERGPEDITLLDLVEAIEGPLVASLPRTQALSSGTQAKLREALSNVTAATRTELKKIKLSHLLPETHRR
ncbi:MAG: Rrf2 family transcriptional regulator [Planctomycetia bacterium]|nr:Rrf2 family transcriptional regulator [Planctomycetia bacterium]